jgi:hypothetical protein
LKFLLASKGITVPSFTLSNSLYNPWFGNVYTGMWYLQQLNE